MIVYAFDVDETLEVSKGPVKLGDLVTLREHGHIVGPMPSTSAASFKVSRRRAGLADPFETGPGLGVLDFMRCNSLSAVVRLRLAGDQSCRGVPF